LSGVPVPLAPDGIGAWPGKTFPAGREHPALWHMLDVGACAEVLVARRGFGDPALDGAAVLLVALHDLGKFSASFRGALRRRASQALYHWQHTEALLRLLDDRLAERLGGTVEVRRHLAAAVAGHHGGPPPRLDPRKRGRQLAQIGDEGLLAAEAALAAVLNLPVDASLGGLDEDAAVALTWRLSGLTVQADWIGSNPDWFGPAPPGIAIPDYWEMARGRAREALRAAGLDAAMLARGGARHVLPKGRLPRPMQAAVGEGVLPLPDGPVLALIEDATGAGKTEAALILAARMMEAGKAGGLFFALPTMATSNAMLGRLDAVVGHLFDGVPSLALTHGRARQDMRFRAIRGRRGRDAETLPRCGDWLADDRRRVLLAEAGVGTIDQALMAVLPTRFSTLRLEALSRRVLIVDEAHSYDPFMEAELSRLLEMQARLGGSAIVMTATLPRAMRDRFAAAYRKGLRAGPVPIPGNAYPALSTVARAGVETRRVDPVRETCRTLPVRRLASADVAIEAIVGAQAKGAACVWIRNAVDDAIDAVEALRARGVAADLLHARFAQCDRLAAEVEAVARFGRDGTPEARAGRVLVATQVVEQSLDLDFDVMVSDLAPIGALIQRAGRLWRHMDLRSAEARPVDGSELLVLAPDPRDVPDARWLHRTFDRGAWVYPPDVQWRTAQVLFAAGDVGSMDAPDGLRALIEAVHGADAVPVPGPLEAAEMETDAEAAITRRMANIQLIETDEPFAQPQLARVWDDERFPTRLGIPQTVLRLARRDGDAFRPWGEDWAASEVQVATHRLEKVGGVPQDARGIAEAKQRWPRWAREAVPLAVMEADGRIGEGLRYDARYGLRFERSLEG
jgi:CRISPR-associated endonuclease/helicase Cas3